MSGVSKRYPPELRERAVRIVEECRHEHFSEWTVIEWGTAKLGIRWAQTLHSEFGRAQVDPGPAGG
jgi:transposase